MSDVSDEAEVGVITIRILQGKSGAIRLDHSMDLAPHLEAVKDNLNDRQKNELISGITGLVSIVGELLRSIPKPKTN